MASRRGPTGCRRPSQPSRQQVSVCAVMSQFSFVGRRFCGCLPSGCWPELEGARRSFLTAIDSRRPRESIEFWVLPKVLPPIWPPSKLAARLRAAAPLWVRSRGEGNKWLAFVCGQSGSGGVEMIDRLNKSCAQRNKWPRPSIDGRLLGSSSLSQAPPWDANSSPAGPSRQV